LKELQVIIPFGTVKAVIGRVGNGSSSLNCILGEMVSITSKPGILGERRATEAMAYYSQETWLENRTIRQNIIGIYLIIESGTVPL
jgi:ABC-type uncharacterized transport system fused permease/ATPase subunit